jgi:hypothetical protein
VDLRPRQLPQLLCIFLTSSLPCIRTKPSDCQTCTLYGGPVPSRCRQSVDYSLSLLRGADLTLPTLETWVAKTGLAQQVADSFLQKSHDLGHGKDHLNVGVLFAGQLAELLHRSLLVDLVSSFHSDSLLFLGRKTTLGPL